MSPLLVVQLAVLATPARAAYSTATSAADCDASLGDYDLNLHIVAIFVLLAASGFGVFFPVLLGQRKRTSKAINEIFFVLRHFGSGIIVSTAYIHLLLEAFLSFHSPCLGRLSYPATAPAIAMAATMLVFTIDFSAARYLQSRAERNRITTTGDAGDGTVTPPTEDTKNAELGGAGHSHNFSESGNEVMTSDEYNRRAIWDVELLEGGIVFHSVFIGVTLGAQGGTQFIPTFCALVFHQLFEGLGLGARIGRLEYPAGSRWQKWAMCSVYTGITPLGIAIGIAVRTTVNFDSRSTLLVVGTFDAISAGILLYGGIAQILVGDWLANSGGGGMRKASLKRVAVGGASLTAGLIAMSVIGLYT